MMPPKRNATAKPPLAILAAVLKQIAGMEALPRNPPDPRAKETAMRDLNYDLKQLCRRNRDGSYATQADREHILDQIADQLEEMGFRHMDAHSLRPKHVEKLVAPVATSNSPICGQVKFPQGDDRNGWIVTRNDSPWQDGWRLL